MGIIVYSLLCVLQDLHHRPYLFALQNLYSCGDFPHSTNLWKPENNSECRGLWYLPVTLAYQYLCSCIT